MEAVTALGSDMPMKLRTATEVPDDLPSSGETRHGSIANDHFVFLAACYACWHRYPSGSLTSCVRMTSAADESM